MTAKKRISFVLGIMTILLLVLFGHKNLETNDVTPSESTSSLPTNTTLSGQYACLPLVDTKTPSTEECIFGLKIDDETYYMVNFGQTAIAKNQFDKRAHIRAEGFVVTKETLNTDQWTKYNMKGIFTITKILEVKEIDQ